MNIAKDLRLDLEHGRRVAVDAPLLERVCDEITRMDKPTPFDWRDSRFFPEDSEGTAKISQYFAVGNAVNFRYWSSGPGGMWRYCEGRKKGETARGAYFMWRSLRSCDLDDVYPILNAEELSRITLSQVRRIFRDDYGNVVMPHLEERLKNWTDLGKKLYEYWGGEFQNLVTEAGSSLFRFVQYSREFRAFDDPLCKMTMVNAIMHQGRGLVKFDEPLFPGIDYQLLKQLTRIGILVPRGRLKDKIIRKRLLQYEEARELRNAGLAAFMVMIDKTGIGGDVIDNMFWANRKACSDTGPSCQVKDDTRRCKFLSACHKRIEYWIPLEHTRYY